MARFEGHVYRQVNHANGEQPLSGKGAEITGGHFHLEVLQIGTIARSNRGHLGAPS